MSKFGSTSVNISYSVAVYDTKVGRGVSICTGFNATVGCLFTQPYISLYGKIDDEIKNIIQEVKKYEFERSKKIKIVVICLQNISKLHSSCIFLYVWIQPNNDKNTLGGTVAKVCVN